MRRWLALTLLLATTLLPATAVSAQDDDPFADFDFQFLKGDALEQRSIAGPAADGNLLACSRIPAAG